MKKRLTWLLCIAALTVCLAASAESAGIPIDETTFPDEAFRAYVLENVDGNRDAMLCDEEIANTTSLFIGNEGLADLTGIAYFTSLTELNCSFNELTSLDVSKNTALIYLSCEENEISGLDASGCTQLVFLKCTNNRIVHLDISGSAKLETLDCYGNRLTTLDVSHCANLESLNCGLNWLTSLDVSRCTKIKTLSCVANKLTNLDVSHNPLLKELDCSQNQLTTLNVTQCPKLERLQCGQNQLTTLNVSHCPRLEELQCTDNQLTVLDVSACPDLEILSCHDNCLTSMDVSGCPYLRSLFCGKYDEYFITVNSARVFNLNRLPGDFDASRASNWVGGSVHGSMLTVDAHASVIYYDYDVGRDDLQIFGGNRASFKIYVTVDDALPSYHPGDASGDGQIDLHDALAILKIGTDEDVIVENGDVNDDGEADIQDALLLFQKEAGWGV